ncbi:MAG: hypothetical protein RJA70_104 [Pseudomonadota bacterium]|jgi:dolichol-phosphate mannosyltransferase
MAVEFLASVNVTWQVVFVDDGSSDRSAEVLSKICTEEPRFALVCLSRNFGHPDTDEAVQETTTDV